MNQTWSSLSSPSQHCHNISEENYFLSPKMPVKDHMNAFRSTHVSLKPQQAQTKPRGILETVDVNDCQKSQALVKSIQSLSQMNLLKEKNLYISSHNGVDKGLNSNIHTRQTNAGYSRNTLGGIYTK